MLDLKAVATDPEGFERRLARRSAEAAALLAPVKDLAARRRDLYVALEGLKKEQSAANARVGQLMRTDRSAGEQARAEARRLGDEVKSREDEVAAIERDIERLLLVVPNPPQDAVPDGADASQNQEMSAWGSKPRFDFQPRPHWDVGEALGILEWQLAA